MHIAAPRPETWLRPTRDGLFCEPGGFHIDPVVPVARAVVTHGHGDHARPGNAAVLATPETVAIMRHRYGAEAGGSLQALGYGEALSVGDVRLRLEPAGHVLGSAQAVIDYRGSRVVVSGDYKRRPDPTCAGFEPQRLRRVRHRGDVRIAGFPPSARQPRDREAVAFGASVPRALPSGRGVCVGEMPAGDRAAARRRVRRAGLSARRAVWPHRAVSPVRDRARAGAARDRGCARRIARAHRAGAAGSARRPLDAAAARPGRGARLGLDAGQAAREGARRRTAAGDFGPRRLGRADRDDRRCRRAGDLGHARPRRGAGALRAWRAASPPARCS